MNEWFIFISKMIALVVAIIVEDYALWKLYIISRESFISSSPSPPKDKPDNQQGCYHAYGETDKQTINEVVVIEELNTRTKKPKNENENRKDDNSPYFFTCGYAHTLNLIKGYYGMIITWLKTKNNQKGTIPFFWYCLHLVADLTEVIFVPRM